MVIKKHIEKTLKKLDVKYNNALLSADPQEATYYSKLATLEYCGWIEESMDLIARRSVKGKIKTNTFQQIFDNSIIGNIHGFQYVRHFRQMMIRTIGIINMEKLEKHLISTNKLDVLKNELDAVRTDRNDAAHTWISGVTKSYPAPSVTLNRLKILYPILRDIYKQIIKM